MIHTRSFSAAVILAGLLATTPLHAAAPPSDDLATVIKEVGLIESQQPLSAMKGWTKPAKIVVWDDAPERLAYLQETVKGVTLAPAKTDADAMKLVSDADGVVGFCTPKMIDAAPKLKWIQLRSAGAGACANHPRVRSGEIVMTNMQRVYGPNIAEHVLAFMLALGRGFPTYMTNQATSEWDELAIPHNELWEVQGKTMFVVGLGGIGTEVARLSHALGMRVIATRNSGREGPDFVDYVGLSSELLDLAPQADVVVNAAPLTPATTNMFNAAFFAKMKPTAFFINVGRGQNVVTDDLLKALQEKRIAGAGLDVTEPEPLPKDHPLWKAPNIIITPHIAGMSDLKYGRFWLVVRENIRRYAAGEKIFSVVDPAQGY